MVRQSTFAKREQVAQKIDVKWFDVFRESHKV